VAEAVDVDNLVKRYDTLAAAHARLKKVYDKLLFDHEKLRRHIIGPQKERGVHSTASAQLPLLELLEELGVLPGGNEDAALTGADSESDEGKPDAETAVEKARRLRNEARAARRRKQRQKKKPHGRRDLSTENLEVVELVLEPPEREAEGGDALIKIGEEVSEHIDHRASSLVRVRVVRPKYKRPDEAPARDDENRRDGTKSFGAPLGRGSLDAHQPRILIADVPERPLPRSLAGPGLLAHVLVSKYADHVPLNRQQKIFRRMGCEIHRSTLGDWVGASTTELLSRVTDAMWVDARDNATYTIADSTGVLVQAPDECKRCHFYVAVVPKRHVLYRFTEVNDGASVAALFEDFAGYVHADAAAVYHEFYRREDVIEVGCWAHARRKFFDSLSRDPERALHGIGLIGLLYDAQREATNDKGVVDGDKRAAASRPILARILWWARKQERSLAGNEPAGIPQALGYLRRQRKALTRFLHDGKLRLDTNPAELALRQEVIGRKNWLFCGSNKGAKWNSVAVSLIASCQMHDIEPWAYLRDVLTLLPAWKQTRVLELAPANWKETLARDDTQALLKELRLFDPAK